MTDIEITKLIGPPLNAPIVPQEKNSFGLLIIGGVLLISIFTYLRYKEYNEIKKKRE